MRDFRDAKAMAQTLREALGAKSIPLTHSDSLELIAKLFGQRDWNTLAARIQAADGSADVPASAPRSRRTSCGKRSQSLPRCSTAMPASTSSASKPSSV
ncbi:glyoxalase superfamily protein [Bradyrhizobium brasilense]|uniref:glyoxalase superfamily protein n=1 Tax=Bradyrhizobium brasilense TaxID=1419277 RepID=UPI003221906C